MKTRTALVSILVVMCMLCTMALGITTVSAADAAYTQTFDAATLADINWECRQLNNNAADKTLMAPVDGVLKNTSWSALNMAFCKSFVPTEGYRYEVDILGVGGGSAGNSPGILFNYNSGSGSDMAGQGYWLEFQGYNPEKETGGSVVLYNLNWAAWTPTPIATYENYASRSGTTNHVSIIYNENGRIVIDSTINGVTTRLFDLTDTTYGLNKIGVVDRMVDSSFDNVTVTYDTTVPEVGTPDPGESPDPEPTDDPVTPPEGVLFSENFDSISTEEAAKWQSKGTDVFTVGKDGKVASPFYKQPTFLIYNGKEFDGAYKFGADISALHLGDGTEAGLVFNYQGTDFQGYRVSILGSSGTIALYKHYQNNIWNPIELAKLSTDFIKTDIRLEATYEKDGSISVDVVKDGVTTKIFENVKDEETTSNVAPYTSGKIGFYSANGEAVFDNVVVSKVEEETPPTPPVETVTVEAVSASAEQDTGAKTATLRFVSQVTGEGVKSFGACVLPVWIFDVEGESSNKAETLSQYANIADGGTFAVDITDIPEAQYGNEIYAKPFVVTDIETIWADEAIRATVTGATK